MTNAPSRNLLTQCCRLEVCPESPPIAPASEAESDLPWENPSKELALVRGEIHLWRASLDQESSRLDQFRALLSEDELARASRFYFENDRRWFIIRRGVLRLILGHYLHVAPALLRFANGVWGKPVLSAPADTDLHFNVSHSDGLALYATTWDGSIGIDIERVRVIREARQIAARFFSAVENAQLNSLPADLRPETFLKYWTRKEACVKASGRGLAETMDRIQTSLASAQPGKAQDSDPQAHYALRELIPAPGYIAALACNGFVPLFPGTRCPAAFRSRLQDAENHECGEARAYPTAQ